MCKSDILLKTAAKVQLFAHTAKLIAQNQSFCAQISRFVQFWKSLQAESCSEIHKYIWYFTHLFVPLQSINSF